MGCKVHKQKKKRGGGEVRRRTKERDKNVNKKSEKTLKLCLTFCDRKGHKEQELLDILVPGAGCLSWSTGHGARLGMGHGWTWGTVGHEARPGMGHGWAWGTVGHGARLGMGHGWAWGTAGHGARRGMGHGWAWDTAGHGQKEQVALGILDLIGYNQTKGTQSNQPFQTSCNGRILKCHYDQNCDSQI